jgi:hypothetical protein
MRMRAKTARARSSSASSAGSAISKPRGTLNHSVGCTSRRLRMLLSTSPGAGRPSSMYSVPPCDSTRSRLWLPPKVWLQGSQSTSTGFSCSRKRHTWAIICMLAHSMRWVLITTLGWPVEPEVSRYLAWSSGRMASKACFTAGLSAVRSRLSKASAPGKVSAPRLNTATASMPLVASGGP